MGRKTHEEIAMRRARRLQEMKQNHIEDVAEVLRKATQHEEPIFLNVSGAPLPESDMSEFVVVRPGQVMRFQLRTSLCPRTVGDKSPAPVLHVPFGFNPDRLVKNVLALFG